MTKREAAIVSAYTGYLIGEFSDFQAYAEEIMGRPVFTHELPNIADELKEKSKKDFMSIKVGNEDKKKEEINMGCKFKDRCPSYSGWCEGIDEQNTDCISDILTVYENEKNRTKEIEWIYHTPFENHSWVDFDAVEKALGFRLFGWQKDYILSGCDYAGRRTGKTTAEILHQLLSVNEEPIDFSRPARDNQAYIFKMGCYTIWEKLQKAGIEMRPVFWSMEDKKKWQMVPDCNDCGYLNYTEKEQQAYGAKSYKKDHRCNCYNRPVYHRASFRNHDPYIYPCDECREDNFVNYFDCESSKCNKKKKRMI